MPDFRLPQRGGVSLKPEYFADVAALPATDMWFEVHPENYMVAGGPRLAGLLAAAERFPVSLHGVGASLGGPEPPSAAHLKELKRLVDRIDPASVSEHAAWSSASDRYFPDLLPLPRTNEALRRLADGIDYFQEMLGRRVLIENPANYLPVASEMDEPDFLNEIAARTGCGLLLDVNNVYVSANNCGIDAGKYIRTIDPGAIGEIHVAGHSPDEQFGARLLIDSHAAPVSEDVWRLLEIALDHTGPVPVLVERDGNLPPFGDLLAERAIADTLIDNCIAGTACA